MLDAQWQLSQAPPGRMKNGVGDRRRHADHRDLAEPLNACLVEKRVSATDEAYVDRADIGVETLNGSRPSPSTAAVLTLSEAFHHWCNLPLMRKALAHIDYVPSEALSAA